MATSRRLPPTVVLEPTDGVLTLTRALRRRGVAVHVLTSRAEAWAGASRGARRTILPPIAAEPEAWIAELEGLAAHGDAVALSGSDAATALLVEHRAHLPNALKTYERTDGGHLELMDKDALYRLADSIGVRRPWSCAVTDELDPRALPYPCVVKPTLRHAGSGPRLYTTLVSSEAELAAVADTARERGLTLLASEYVPGEETALEAHVSVRAPDGSWPMEYTRRKIRQFPPGFGVGTLQEAIAAPDCAALARKLLEGSGFFGLSSVEAKRDAVTGELVLIEVNVRLPQSFALGDAAGIDASWRTYATLAGIAVGSQPAPRIGSKALIPQLDLRAAWHGTRHGGLSVADVARSYRGVRDVGVADLRDPSPFARWLATRASGRLRG